MDASQVFLRISHQIANQGRCNVFFLKQKLAKIKTSNDDKQIG